MSCSTNDDDKKVSGLLLIKMFPKEVGLPIYNTNDLTNDEFKILIQNFFENNDGCEDFDKYGNKECIYTFIFESNSYKIIPIGEENNAKKSIIKFLNFLKNIMIKDFYCLSDYDYDADIVNLIGEAIKNSKVISRFSFPISYFKNDAFEILHVYLKDHENLKFLHILYGPMDKLSDKHIGLLVDVIKSSTIEDINGLHKDDYKLVFESLLTNFFRSKKPNMKYTFKDSTSDFSLKLSNMIIDKNINYLKEIYINDNNITSEEFSMLVDSLLKSNNKDIIKIDICNNKLDDDCIEKLGELINQNQNINYINIESNKITDKGIEKLSEYVVGNVFIESINLSFNHEITDNSFNVIKNMINSSKISNVGIYKTKITEEFKLKIEDLLKIPIDQREIPLITIGNVKSASKIMKE